jgi:hypothetical protein
MRDYLLRSEPLMSQAEDLKGTHQCTTAPAHRVFCDEWRARIEEAEARSAARLWRS